MKTIENTNFNFAEQKNNNRSVYIIPVYTIYNAKR